MTMRIVAALLLCAGFIFSTGCATQPASSDAISAYDLPRDRIAVAYAGCETAAAAETAVRQWQHEGGAPEGCVGFPRPMLVDTGQCAEMHGIWRDWEGDPFISCRVVGATQKSVWIFVWFMKSTGEGA